MYAQIVLLQFGEALQSDVKQGTLENNNTKSSQHYSLTKSLASIRPMHTKTELEITCLANGWFISVKLTQTAMQPLTS